MKKKENGNNFLGSSTKANGTMSCHGHIRIDGHFTGGLSVEGMLIIGEDALLNASIHATSILIAGEIHGTITADHIVEIEPQGKVFGEIQSPTLRIDEGAIFEGQCQMSKSGEASERQADHVWPDTPAETSLFLYSSKEQMREEPVAGANP